MNTKHLIRESYSYSALQALSIVLRGSYSYWEFELKRKDSTRTYHQLYTFRKKDTKDYLKRLYERELKDMKHYAHIWVNGYEWGCQDGEE